MRIRSAVVALSACVAVSCSASPAPNGPPGALVPDTPDAATGVVDAGFSPAEHAAFPTVPNRGGTVLARAKLVTITFAGYPYEGEVQRFGDWIVDSSWLDTVCKEYGCGADSRAAHVVVNETPPATMTGADVEAMLRRLAQSGSLPSPASDVLYVVYFPRETVVNPTKGSNGCDTGPYYHFSTTIDGAQVAYAVVPDCSWHRSMKAMFSDLSPVETIEEAASHEILEALTDPFYPAAPAFLLDDANDPWTTMGGEVADWCVGLTTREAGFAVTRAWSNQRAAAGGDPCVPARADVPYFNASPTGPKIVRVRPGEKAELQVVGWSTAPIEPWALRVLSMPPLLGGFDAKPTASGTAIGNGDSITVTVSAPPTAVAGDRATFLLASSRPGDTWFHQWPVIVEAR